MEYIWIALGIFLLFFGGDYLVKGATGLSLRYGLSPMIVGLTVVALGTSAPELIVSVQAATTGHGSIAFGNVIGSNIANVLLILGVPALITPIAIHECEAGRPWFEMMFVSVLLVPLLAMTPFGWQQGMVLLMFFVLILLMQLQRARAGEISLEDEVDTSAAELPLPQILAFLALGLILLPIGADRLVEGASEVARSFGIPEAVIGLTVVAIGTSLPELAASTAAALRKETELAVGNVIGSNFFNIALVLGATGLVADVQVDRGLFVKDLPFMLAVSALLGLLIMARVRIDRKVGAAMVLGYLAYILWFNEWL